MREFNAKIRVEKKINTIFMDNHHDSTNNKKLRK